MLKLLYLNGRVELGEICKLLDLNEGTVSYVLSHLIDEIKQESTGRISFLSQTLGNKLEPYQDEETIKEVEYTVESLEGDEKGILHLINNGQIKVEPLK